MRGLIEDSTEAFQHHRLRLTRSPSVRLCAHVLYSFAVQYQLAQLCLRIARLRQIYRREPFKLTREEDLSELPYTMTKCKELPLEYKRKISELKEFVQQNSAMKIEWQLWSRSGGSYQRPKASFEHDVQTIIRERLENGSYAARWGKGIGKIALATSAVYKLCMCIPAHGSCDCDGSNVFNRPPLILVN